MKLRKVEILLFLYHLVFIVFSYQYAVLNRADAHYYWAIGRDIAANSWLDFLNFGTDFILFLNYPLLQLGLPFWVGFFIYGTIGFFGILKWMQWAEVVLGDKLRYKGINLLYLIFLLPNLHFWTATLGKEPLVFWALAVIFYTLATHNFKSVSFIIGCLLLVIIRPHVALMLFAAVVVVQLFRNRMPLKRKISMAVAAAMVVSVLLYWVLQLTAIRYWDWKRIEYYNAYSILSFRHSGSYVPMLEYTYPERLFALWFRPLFVDAHTLLGYIASIENVLMLLVLASALVFVVLYYRKIQFPNAVLTALAFMLIASLLYIERYANLGIFMRTKIMWQPFVLIALLCLIRQGIAQTKLKA